MVLRVNCIYNDCYHCEHIEKRKRFLLWKYKPYCDNADNCELRKVRYPRPERPPKCRSVFSEDKPLTIKVSIDSLTNEQIKKLLDDDNIRNLFVKLMRESAKARRFAK